ncbi:MAG TPA: response regulator [Elusimicrobiota bacterium]|nr:response regulator [Elusimicrobiota bacterium]
MHKILIVDDDPAIRELVGRMLEKEGFSVQSVESAEDALRFLRMTLFDLIVLDLNLPGISGMKMCEILKQDPATATLPVIMLTSASAERSKVQGLQTGADDYIVKPPSPPELMARINALLRRVKYGGVPAKVLEAGGPEWTWTAMRRRSMGNRSSCVPRSSSCWRSFWKRKAACCLGRPFSTPCGRTRLFPNIPWRSTSTICVKNLGPRRLACRPFPASAINSKAFELARAHLPPRRIVQTYP